MLETQSFSIILKTIIGRDGQEFIKGGEYPEYVILTWNIVLYDKVDPLSETWLFLQNSILL